MIYSINIATRNEKKGFDGSDKFTHFAKVTMEHVTEEEAKARYQEFCIRFPATLYSLTLTKWETIGYQLGDRS